MTLPKCPFFPTMAMATCRIRSVTRGVGKRGFVEKIEPYQHHLSPRGPGTEKPTPVQRRQRGNMARPTCRIRPLLEGVG